MKNILFVLLLTATLTSAYAQCVPYAPTGQGGFSPHPDSLPSIRRGQPYYTVIHMENYDSIPGSPVGPIDVINIIVDSFTGGPVGINFNLLPGDTIDGGETACLEIYGTTTDTPGHYTLKAWGTFNVNIPLLGVQSMYGDITDMMAQLVNSAPLPDTPALPYYLVVDSFVGPAPRITSGSPCGGGTITIDANIAGLGNYLVSWTGTIPVDDPNASITTVTIPPTGTYTFTAQAIETATGDTTVGSITINASASPYSVSAGSDASIGCTGGRTALLHASISTTNGAGSTFKWSNGPRSELNRVAPGTYIVTATDAGGCLQATDTVTVFGNLDITLSGTHETCGGNDGAVVAQVSGGAGGNSYSWSNGTSAASIGNLTAGTYSLSVADLTGCVVTDSITLLDSCGVIRGTVFHDFNRNGVQDVFDYPRSGITVSAGSLSTLSNSNGGYEIIVPSYGTYTLSVDTPDHYYCFGSVLLPDAITAPVTGTLSVNISSGNGISNGNDFGLADAQPTCGTATGNVFEDLDSNGVKDAGEPGSQFTFIYGDPVGFAFTDANGDYSMDLPFNTPVQLSLAATSWFYPYFCFFNFFNFNNNGYRQTLPANNGGYNVTVTQNAPTSANNDFGFAVTPPDSFDVGIYNLWPDYPVACQPFNVYLDWLAHGTLPSGCYLMLDVPASAAFVSSSPLAPDTVGTGFIGWRVPAGVSSSFFESYVLEFYLDCAALPGASLTFNAHWECPNPDSCPGDDQLSRTVTVWGTPKRGQAGADHFMAVYHQNDQEKYTINPADSTFSYVIAMRNTTNDTAYNITVIDTLPPHFQLNTISRPFSNLPFNFKVRNDNVLIWEFENVKLPPAKTNRKESMAYIQFNIVMKGGLPGGTLFENRAAVLYNYGDAIITNKAVNVLGGTTGTGSAGTTGDVQVMPNPNEGRFAVSAVSANKTDWRLEIFSITGSRLFYNLTEGQQELHYTIDAAHFPKGMYLLKVSTGEKTFVEKLVIH